jgi:hypothetical protein
MIYHDTTAIEAANTGRDAPDAFYRGSTLIATSKWVATDGWRGYTKIVPEQGYKEIEADWVTGDWDDAPAGNSSSEVEAKIKKLEAEYGDIYVIYATTSNVFSTAYAVLVRDKSTPVLKGKTVAYKTKRYDDADGSYRIKYHATDVLCYNALKNSYTLNSGGWLTKTTKERINDNLPRGYWISQKQFKWTLNTPDGAREFTDGMTV